MSESIYPQNQPLPQPQLQMQAQTQSQAQSQTQNDTENLQYNRPAPGIPDQVYTPDGAIKPEWDYLLSSLNNLGSTALKERQDKARRILRDDGVTYNIYDKKADSNSQWELDLVPAIIGQLLKPVFLNVPSCLI